MLSLIPIIILWLTNLASPVWCEYRYIYGMFTTMPIFLFAVTSLLNSEKDKSLKNGEKNEN